MQWYGPAAVGIVTTNPLLRLPEFLSGILLYGLYREHALDGLTQSAVRGTLFLISGLSFVGGSWLLEHGPFYWQYIVHNGALMPAELALIIACASGGRLPPGVEKLAARLGNAALSIFAIHLPLFLLFMKIQKLFVLGESPLACIEHFSSCIGASRQADPTMSMYPLYLIGTVVAAVYFQEKVVVPIRDALRRRFLSDRGPTAAKAVHERRRLTGQRGK
jgi:peptidoglycan/LPS O-acetylase OafA/YrhL